MPATNQWAVSTLIREVLADPDLARRASGQIPLGRMGSPKDVARAVAFFASEESSYVTGQVLAVDGGMTMC